MQIFDMGENTFHVALTPQDKRLLEEAKNVLDGWYDAAGWPENISKVLALLAGLTR